jgi:hypothetical protein
MEAMATEVIVTAHTVAAGTVVVMVVAVTVAEVIEIGHRRFFDCVTCECASDFA